MIVPPEYQISEKHKFYLKNVKIGCVKPILNDMDVNFFNKIEQAEKEGRDIIPFSGRGMKTHFLFIDKDI